MKTLLVMFAGIFLLTATNVAQMPQESDQGYENVQSTEEIGQTNIYQPDKQDSVRVNNFQYLMSSHEFCLSFIVLIFGILVLFVEVILIFKKKIGQENILRFVIITLIITSTLFLITAGYDNNQIAPAMGLLGTIAGYLLGKSREETIKNDKSSS